MKASQLLNEVERALAVVGQFLIVRRCPAMFTAELILEPAKLEVKFLELTGYVKLPALVAVVAFQFAHDRDRRVGGELGVVLAGLEPPDGLD